MDYKPAPSTEDGMTCTVLIVHLRLLHMDANAVHQGIRQSVSFQSKVKKQNKKMIEQLV